MNPKALLTILCIFCTVFVFSQSDSTKRVLVTKHDGGQYSGIILSDDGREILLETKEIGKIYIPKHLIKNIEVISKKQDVIVDSTPTNQQNINEEEFPDEYNYRNFMSTKYIQGDNAFPLRKGESFIKFMPLGMEGQAYLRKNWSIGALTSYIGAPFAVRSKLSFPVKDSNYFSLDVIYGSMMFGSLYGAGIGTGGGAFSAGFTFGNRLSNFTIKTGFVFLHEEVQNGWWDEVNWTWNEGPVVVYGYPAGYVSFSGMTEVSARSQLVFDLFAGAGTGGTMVATGAAFRFGPKPRHRFQLGLSLVVTDGFFIPVPIPNISYSFILPKFQD